MSLSPLSLSLVVVPHPGSHHTHHCPSSLSLILIVLILTVVPCLALLLSLVLPCNCPLPSSSSLSPVLVLTPRPQVRMHPYDCPLHQKVIEHFIYIWDGSLIHSEIFSGLNHGIVIVWCVSSCYSNLQLSPPSWLWWSEDASIRQSIAPEFS